MTDILTNLQTIILIMTIWYKFDKDWATINQYN